MKSFEQHIMIKHIVMTTYWAEDGKMHGRGRFENFSFGARLGLGRWLVDGGRDELLLTKVPQVPYALLCCSNTHVLPQIKDICAMSTIHVVATSTMCFA